MVLRCFKAAIELCIPVLGKIMTVLKLQAVSAATLMRYRVACCLKVTAAMAATACSYETLVSLLRTMSAAAMAWLLKVPVS